ncbi:MAG TPA: ATP-binding protein [Ilumatobacter sp.]|nr:ATP-binding protein [Ilumatobacter sp.]
MAWLLGAAGVAGVAAGFTAGWILARRRRIAEPVDAPAAPVAPSTFTLLDAHRTGVVVADAEGRVTYRNAAAQAMTGTHVGVLVDAAVEKRLALSRHGEAGDEIVELFGPPKQVLDVVSRPLPDGGSVVFVDDITERRRLDQVRTDFIANVSHELKTPIGALSVLAEMLVDETDPSTVGRVVGRMMSEAQRASNTIDDLIELSRIELGDDRSTDPVKLGGVVAAAIDRVTELATQRQIDITATGAGLGGVGSPVIVAGDRLQLVSAVGNLVENAVKYSEPGGPVRIRIDPATVDGTEWLEITVADQGVGIPQRDLARIFERFYRVDRARSRGTGGTGLGLSIVRHVATNHGGEVIVSSVEGEGSTFVLRLPASQPAQPDPTPPTGPQPTTWSARQPTTQQGAA